MRNGAGCRNFVNPYKGVAMSTHGNKIGEVQRKDFCLKFHTEVGSRCVCRHQKDVDDITGDGDE